MEAADGPPPAFGAEEPQLHESSMGQERWQEGGLSHPSSLNFVPDTPSFFACYTSRMSRFVVICGRQPELSAAELAAFFSSKHVSLAAANEQAILLEGEGVEEAFPMLGGAVKLGRVVLDLGNVAELTTERFLQGIHPHFAGGGKAIFGVSAYGDAQLHRVAAKLGKALKTFLSENGRPARFLLGERGILSSVVVGKERLIERGAEILLVQRRAEVLVAVTVAVQAFEDFSRRDYGRPRRDSRSGMLPPKLARMMLNLTGLGPMVRLLDPFCGSGTILQEALLLGYTSVVGTDASASAIAETRANLDWLAKHDELSLRGVTLKTSKIQTLGKLILPGSVDVVVTEPFLGPPLRGGEDLAAIRSELEELYKRSFGVFAGLLRPGGRVVFAAPVFFLNKKPHGITDLNVLRGTEFQLLPTPGTELLPEGGSRLSFRRTPVYQRPDQRIGRELLLFERR